MSFRNRLAPLASALTLAGLLWAAPANAQYRVTQDVSALSGFGTVYLAFQLSDGSQSGNDTGRVDISNVSLIGVTLEGAGSALGGATGDLATSLTLRDTDASFNGLADFTQGFVVTGGAGSRISFDLDLFSSAVDAPTPDAFFFYLLDETQTPFATTGPTQAEFIAADFTTTTDGGSVITPSVFGASDGSKAALPAPGVPFRSLTPSAAPEPGSVALLLAGGAGGLVAARRRRPASC